MHSPTTAAPHDGDSQKQPTHTDLVWKGTSRQGQDGNSPANSHSSSTYRDHVTSQYLSELPDSIQARMPVGKKCFSGCVRKQHKDVTIYLLNADLWKSFRQIGTEMIITKRGRRVFPIPSYVIRDLDPNKLYNVTLEIVAVDNAAYKFSNGEWTAFRAHSYQTPAPGRETYLHPYSPNTGIHWMNEPISFSGLKISNNLEAAGTIVLQSMRKYQMKLIVSELGGSMEVHIPQPETHFVAVTQYQNDRVTQMKIENNPFANGFKFSSAKSKDRSSQSGSHDGDTEEENQPDSAETYGSLQTSQRSNSSNAQRNVNRHTEYLMKKRATFKSLLPHFMDIPYHEPGKFEDTRMPELGLRFDFEPKVIEKYTPNFLQSHTTPPLDGLCYSSHDQLEMHRPFPVANFMYPPAEENALAQVRHLAEINKLSNGIEKPLSLVTNSRNRQDESGMRKGSHCQELSPSTPKFQKDALRKRRKVSSLGDVEMHVDVECSKNVPNLPYYPQCDEMTTGGGRTGVQSYWAGEQDSEGLQSPKDLTLKSKNNVLGFASEDTTHGHFPSSNQRPKVSLKNRDLWATTHEVVISTDGRPMFPYICLTITNLEPLRPYSIDVELTPASRWLYEYTDGEWTPCLETTNDLLVTPYQHPDSPRSGHEWGTDISFDKLRLSTTRQGKNLIKVQIRRQYYPVITIRTPGQVWTYPLKDAMFITVSIDRSPFLEPSRAEKESELIPGHERLSTASEHLLRSSHRKQTNPKKARHETHSSNTTPETKGSSSFDEDVFIDTSHRLTSTIQCSHPHEVCLAANTHNFNMK